MKISEVAELTGLSISNIRFYERKGLIAPDRRVDSKYRDYTSSDIELIKRIVLYRRMDLSIEEIQTIITEESDDKLLVKSHITELKEKQEMLDNSLELCQMFIEDEGENLDTDYYLNYVKQEENNGRLYTKIDEIYNDFEEFSKSTVLPDNSLVSAFVPEIWRKRISVFACGMTIIGLPLIAMLHIREEGFLRLIIMWGFLCLFFFIGFFNYRSLSKINENIKSHK